MMTFPYDTTDTWGATWNTGYDVVFNGIFNVFSPPAPAGGTINTTGGDAGENPELQKECRNVVREIRDLLFNQDQTWQLIDECATIISKASVFGGMPGTKWSEVYRPANPQSSTCATTSRHTSQFNPACPSTIKEIFMRYLNLRGILSHCEERTLRRSNPFPTRILSSIHR